MLKNALALAGLTFSEEDQKAMLQGAKVAEAEINAAGGVLGNKVTLVTGDTSCDVADGVNSFANPESTDMRELPAHRRMGDSIKA